MGKELGEKKVRIRTNFAYVLPLFYTVAALLMVGLLVIPATSLESKLLISIIFVSGAVILAAYILIQMFYSHIMLHENAIVIVSLFSKKIIMRDDITVIHWDRPGVYEGTTRAVVRKNIGAAEVMLKDGKKVRIPDSVYKDVYTILGDWQNEYNIPREF
jgi:hypothetical protein